LFVDTFNRYFERENVDAALAVLGAAGYRVEIAKPADQSTRPLCCGRTFLAVGAVEEARREAERSVAALAPFVERGVPVVGLEPSCLFGFRDEIPALLRSDAARRLAGKTFTFEEFLAAQADAEILQLALDDSPRRVLLHGHCHQKSLGVMASVERALRLLPGLEVETVQSSCCGMAGALRHSRHPIQLFPRLGRPPPLPPPP